MTSRVENLTIGAFAQTSGVNIETIRYYQRRGLLSEPRKPLGGIRRYGESDVARVHFIKTAQRLGFTLEEVALLLKLDDGTHCSEAAAVAQHKLTEVRARLSNRLEPHGDRTGRSGCSFGTGSDQRNALIQGSKRVK